MKQITHNPLGKLGRTGTKLVLGAPSSLSHLVSKGVGGNIKRKSTGGGSPASRRHEDQHAGEEGEEEVLDEATLAKLLAGVNDLQKEEELLLESAILSKTGPPHKDPHFQLLSPAEEKLLEGSSFGVVGNVLSGGEAGIERLTLQLEEELNALEIANTYALLSSGSVIQQLVGSLQAAEDQLDALDAWIASYEAPMREMKTSLEEIAAVTNHKQT
ncbi:hypothetical protein QOT17_015419 [Balamuthia mandrillaris]